MHPDQERRAYERETDRKNEAAVVAFLFSMLGWQRAERTPRYYPCDWVVELRPGAWALLEVKVRDRHYSRYMLSLHKAASLLSMAQVGGFTPMLAVAWRDRREVGVWDLGQVAGMLPGVGGRTDRQDAQDFEPVVMIPDTSCARYAWL